MCESSCRALERTIFTSVLELALQHGSVMKRQNCFPRGRRPRSDRTFERLWARSDPHDELLHGRNGATVNICCRKELERGEHARYRYPCHIQCEMTARAFAAAKTEPCLRERRRVRRGIEEALGLEFRGFWVGRRVVQDRPRIVKDHGPSRDEVVIVDVIFGQTVWDTKWGWRAPSQYFV